MKVLKVGKINVSQDGVIVLGQGLAPCLTSGHGNCPKVLMNDEKMGYKKSGQKL